MAKKLNLKSPRARKAPIPISRDNDIPRGNLDLFQEIRSDLSINPSRSIEWFKSKARELGTVNPSTILNQQNRSLDYASIGTMVFFKYDPKYKATLPYYDTFPLVIPFSMTSNGFLGLNLHYLPFKMRFVLLEKLMVLARDTRIGTEKRLRLSWEILTASTRYREVKPCVKRYLWTHVESRFIFISSSEWKIASVLPVDRFVGASINKVWNDSQNKITLGK